MTIMKLKTINIFIVLTISNICVFAQHFAGSAKLDSVKNDGFYSIILPPTVTSKLNQNFSDLRIINSKGVETPYILATEGKTYHSSYFKEYKIEEKKIVPKCSTSIVIKNENKTEINNISVEVKNADVVKFSQVLGSDDAKNWFAIKSAYLFDLNNHVSQPNTFNIINFPISNYRYFKIDFIDSNSAPINIIRAGYFDTKIQEGKFTLLPSPSFKVVNHIDTKQTFINIKFPKNELIDRLEFTFSGPKFYQRDAVLGYYINLPKNKKEFHTITDFTLKSSEINAFDLAHSINMKDLVLIIQNENNPELTTLNVQAFQLTKYLKTYLSKGEKYTLNFSDKNALAPIYDLEYFSDSIPGILANIQLDSVTYHQHIHHRKPHHIKKWYENTIIIWSILISVLGLMTFIVFAMLKDIKKE